MVCDDVTACKHEAGELAAASEAGAFDWSSAVALGDVVGKCRTVRRSSADVIVFKSVGLAVEDVALGVEILHRAQRAGRGTPLPF
ncbi:MAG: hypothetical protein QM775_14635 [Pirellulales bacterium]